MKTLKDALLPEFPLSTLLMNSIISGHPFKPGSGTRTPRRNLFILTWEQTFSWEARKLMLRAMAYTTEEPTRKLPMTISEPMAVSLTHKEMSWQAMSPDS